MTKSRDLLFSGGVDNPEAKARLDAWIDRVEVRAGFKYDPDAEFRHAAQARDRRDQQVTFPGEDHRRCWRKRGMGVLYTSQPYSEPTADLTEMKAACERYGLGLFVSADMSWHYPDTTILVVAARPEILAAVGLSPL